MVPAEPPDTFSADQSQVPARTNGCQHNLPCGRLPEGYSPVQEPEPQFTSTRFAPLATAMELVLPEKFTPWSASSASASRSEDASKQNSRKASRLCRACQEWRGSSGGRGVNVRPVARHHGRGRTWSIMTPNLRMPVAVLPEKVMPDTVEPVAAALVLMRRALSLEGSRSACARSTGARRDEVLTCP